MSFDFNLTLNSGTHGVNIWIDWNQDLDFDDTGEKVYASGSQDVNHLDEKYDGTSILWPAFMQMVARPDQPSSAHASPEYPHPTAKSSATPAAS